MSKQEGSAEQNWYAIHTYVGYENAVMRNLKQRIESLGMEDKIFNALVPKEKKIKIKDGKRVTVEEKIFPGAHAVHVAVKDLNLPPNCIISGIIRHGEIVIPRGITTLEEGDEILALVDDAARGQLEKILGRPAEMQSN